MKDVKDIEFAMEMEEATQEIEQIQERLRELKAVGKVKVEDTVFAGVKIYVRDVLDEVKMDVKNTTFYFEKSFSKRGPYEPPALEEEVPSGYSSN